MFKAAGVILVIAVGAATGFRASQRLRTRYKKLFRFYAFIRSAADRMRLGEELERIYKSSEAAELLSVSGYRATVKSEGLSGEDIRLLEEFFSSLGMTDIDSGVDRCAVFCELLLRRVGEAEEDMKSKSRLYSILGCFCGVFVALILV